MLKIFENKFYFDGYELSLDPQRYWDLFVCSNSAFTNPEFLLNFKKVCPRITLRCPEQTLQIVVTRNLIFWYEYQAQKWEPFTLRVLDRFIKKSDIFFDIGAWIGPTALYGATKAKKVFAFEPDPVAFQELVDNVTSNPDLNILPVNSAVCAFQGITRFGSRTVPGDSMSSALFSQETSSWPAHSINLEKFIHSKGLAKSSFF